MVNPMGFIEQRDPQWGVKGTGAEARVADAERQVFYVEPAHANASDNNEGTDPLFPLATLGTLMTRTWSPLLQSRDIVYVKGLLTESVTTPDYTAAPSYVTIAGVGPHRYAAQWTSGGAALACLDLRAVGWSIENIRFYGAATAACVQLRHTDTGANDIAIRTHIRNCYFDGLTTGRYGIATHGCYDVWIENCTFSLWHNAVAGGAIAIWLESSPLAIPYRQHIKGCMFYDNDNHIICPMNGSFVYGCMFQPTGYAYASTQQLETSLGGNPGDDNVIFENIMPGDYSIVGGYNPGAADVWVGNWADDVAEAEVGDNGIAYLRPA